MELSVQLSEGEPQFIGSVPYHTHT